MVDTGLMSAQQASSWRSRGQLLLQPSPGISGDRILFFSIDVSLDLLLIRGGPLAMAQVYQLNCLLCFETGYFYTMLTGLEIAT